MSVVGWGYINGDPFDGVVELEERAGQSNSRYMYIVQSQRREGLYDPWHAITMVYD